MSLALQGSFPPRKFKRMHRDPEAYTNGTRVWVELTYHAPERLRLTVRALRSYTFQPGRFAWVAHWDYPINAYLTSDSGREESFRGAVNLTTLPDRVPPTGVIAVVVRRDRPSLDPGPHSVPSDARYTLRTWGEPGAAVDDRRPPDRN